MTVISLLTLSITLLVTFGSTCNITYQDSTVIQFSYYFVLIAAGDLDNNGILDYVALPQMSYFGIIMNYAGDLDQYIDEYTVGRYQSCIIVSDINNDNMLDILILNYIDNNISIQLGRGNGMFTNSEMFSTNVHPISFVTGDFNNDNNLDIAAISFTDHNVAILLGFGNGTFQNKILFSTGNSPQSIAIGDINNDNILDIVVSCLIDGNIYIYLGYGNGSFIENEVVSTGSINSINTVVLSDFNNDNHLDIAVTVRRLNKLIIYIADENGAISRQSNYSTGISPTALAAYDFNQDNQNDIILINFVDSTIGIYFGHGDGTFDSPITLPTAFPGFYFLIIDFNNDHLLDIGVVTDGFRIEVYYTNC